ncbi:hypothetical protein TPSD3_04380 [Thioflexithrix psekupsensis]|nr:hypothetical protein TPSD3_04380 [Thioflexithrix psekupsensis]
MAFNVEQVINANKSRFSEILDSIDNYIPLHAIPYGLTTTNHHTKLQRDKLVFEELAHLINGLSHIGAIERDCLEDYFSLLKNAILNQSYHFIKPAQYYKRISYLAENTQKNIIATYLHDTHHYQNGEISSFSQYYFSIQKKLIIEKNISVKRLFITRKEQPDERLLMRMYQEQQAGIEVLYLREQDWVEPSLLEKTGVLDLAIFDEKIAIILTGRECFSQAQSTTMVSNLSKIQQYIELFNANWDIARPLTTEQINSIHPTRMQYKQ